MSFVLRKERLGKARIVIRQPNDGGDDDRELVVTYVAGDVDVLKADDEENDLPEDTTAIDESALQWAAQASTDVVDSNGSNISVVANLVLAVAALTRRVESLQGGAGKSKAAQVGTKLIDALPDHVRDWDVTDEKGVRIEPTRENVELFCKDLFRREALLDGWQFVSFGIIGKNLATGRDGSLPQTVSDLTTAKNAAIAAGVKTAITGTTATDAPIPESIQRIPQPSARGA